MATKNENATKPTFNRYLTELAPDSAVIDMVEQYGAQHNKIGVFNDIFFYYPDGTTTLPFYRALIKYEGDLKIQPGTGLAFTKNNEKYAILIGKNISLAGTSFVCGVAL